MKKHVVAIDVPNDRPRSFEFRWESALDWVQRGKRSNVKRRAHQERSRKPRRAWREKLNAIAVDISIYWDVDNTSWEAALQAYYEEIDYLFEEDVNRYESYPSFYDDVDDCDEWNIDLVDPLTHDEHYYYG